MKQTAENTVAALQHAPRNAAVVYRFISQVKAYLALSDAMPRPSPFPAAAEQQFSELRDGLQRVQQHFEAMLDAQNQAAQAQDADPNGLKRYAEANGKTVPPGKLPRVVFLGDAVTEGWRLNEYFTGRDFINRGIGGQTTTQMLGRFLEDVAGLHPKAVLIQGGANDLARGVAPGAIEDDFTMMGDLAKAHGIKPLFASLPPAGGERKDSAPMVQQINRWLQDYCRKENFVYVDYYAVLAASNGQMQADLADDGVQPNSKGYRVMSPIALEAIGRVIAGLDRPADEQAKRRFRLPVVQK